MAQGTHSTVKSQWMVDLVHWQAQKAPAGVAQGYYSVTQVAAQVRPYLWSGQRPSICICVVCIVFLSPNICITSMKEWCYHLRAS